MPEYRAAVIGQNGVEVQVYVGTSFEDVVDWLEMAKDVFSANEVRIKKMDKEEGQ